jgi:hypothetical protein
MSKDERNAYEVGFSKGYAMGVVDGSKALTEYLTRKEQLSVRPIFLCAKCAKELGFIKESEEST